MKYRSTVISIMLITSLITFSTSTDSQYFNSNEYQQKSAADKMSEIWPKISGDQTSGTFPNAILQSGILVEPMDKTFDTHGDQMPVCLFNLPRVKYIHSVGVVGKVQFISSNSGYTGIFKGANQGIVRLSAAAKPSTSWLLPQPLAPGMALKFLRNGVESANLVAMYSVNGQKSWNFFEHDFSNHIGTDANSLLIKTLAYKFSTFTKYITEVGLSDMSGIDEEGNTEYSNKIPFKLRFEPHADVKTLFSNLLNGNDPMNQMTQLPTVPENSILQNVYAYDKPEELGGTETTIGVLQLDGKLIRSNWGDKTLFFRHQLESEDLSIHPEWTKYCPYYH